MKTLIEYAKSFIGQPYIWGAEGVSGFDCSGLVQEILRSVGEDPSGDQSAQALHDHFRKVSPDQDGLVPGSLVFYGRDTKCITHVAFAIDSFRVIEAGGGGSKCINPEIAARLHAMVRMRPYRHRGDMVSILIPEYAYCKKE